MNPDASAISVLRVAISGHRDLVAAQLPDLRLSVGRVLEQLRARADPAAVEIVTGMADGADQLVAEVALGLGCRLHIALPKPVEEYRAELSEGAGRLLDDCIARPEARVSVIGEADAEPTGDVDGSLPYHRLGLYLARSAHVLIAMWDGRAERKPGGTLDVLSNHLDRRYQAVPTGEPPRLIEDGALVETLPGPTAVWIQTARADDKAPDSTAVTYLIGSGVPGLWHQAEHVPPTLGRILDDVSMVAAAIAAADSLPETYPLVEEMPRDLAPGRRAALAEIQDSYVVADGLAITNQSRSDRAFIGATLIAAAMGFAFLWFAKIDDHPAWLYAYLILFVVGYALFRTSRSGHWLRNHLSMRVLAETLRVRFFVALLGIADRVDVRRVLALSGVSSFPGFAWVAEADRVGVATTAGPPSEVADRSELVRSSWVHDQAGYFERRSRQLHGRHRRLEAIQVLLYVLSFATVVVIIVFGSELKKYHALPGEVSAKTVLVFSMGLLPLWLTLWELHQGRMATRELLWQFRNQATMFRHASNELRQIPDEETRLRIYVELAERSLFETYLWTIHRFHREFAPPSGG